MINRKEQDDPRDEEDIQHLSTWFRRGEKGKPNVNKQTRSDKREARKDVRKQRRNND